MNFDALKDSLDRLLQAIRKETEHADVSEVCGWLKAAVVKIWSANERTASVYTEALSVFGGPTYSIGQVIAALECAGEPGRTLNVPKFFCDIVEQDQKNRNNASVALIDEIAQFLAEMALVNGDFTLQEASALREITDMLGAYCQKNHIKMSAVKPALPRVTPINTAAYYTEQQETAHEGVTAAGAPPHRSDIGDSNGASVKNEGVSIPIEVRLTIDETNDQGKVTHEISKVNGNGYTVSDHSDDGNSDTLESVLAELNGLVGLENVKADVQSLLNFIKICRLRRDRGMKVAAMSYHLVFTGNPGTGKTTVARLIAKLYYLMGLLPQGQLVETDRSGLVAGYLGQTAIKTQKVIQQALGGVLFIDEAYSLANDEKDVYGMEAIETILKAMEDHREELIVIVAGYDELMHQFIDSNPGLRSRFNKYFRFPDYTGEEMLRILERFCDTNGYVLHGEAIPFLRERLQEAYGCRDEHFGNARYIRNVFERAINHQANRLASDWKITDEELMTLRLSDIQAAMEAE